MTDTAQTYDEDKDKVPGQRGNPNLTPFRKGDGRASAAGKASADKRRAARASRATAARDVSDALASVLATFHREDLGDASAAVAGWLLGRISAGQVPVRNAGEAADLLRALVDVARLEAGQATSTSVVAHVGSTATAEVLALRDRARTMLGTGMASTALAAGDRDHDQDPADDQDQDAGQ